MNETYRPSFRKIFVIPTIVITLVLIVGADIYFRLRNGLSFLSVVEITNSEVRLLEIFSKLWLSMFFGYLASLLMSIKIDDKFLVGQDLIGRRQSIAYTEIADIKIVQLGLVYKVSSSDKRSVYFPRWVLNDSRFRKLRDEIQVHI